LNCTTVEINKKVFPIICGASNIKVGMKVPVAVV
jgi:tRNA-binding EMAP/Myf-like protein